MLIKKQNQLTENKYRLQPNCCFLLSYPGIASVSVCCKFYHTSDFDILLNKHRPFQVTPGELCWVAVQQSWRSAIDLGRRCVDPQRGLTLDGESHLRHPPTPQMIQRPAIHPHPAALRPHLSPPRDRVSGTKKNCCLHLQFKTEKYFIF